MSSWRMRMRKGNGGLDMFEQCLIQGVAAIHYAPVEDVDLSRFIEAEPPPEWQDLESSQSGSLRKFAWRIKGGDTIYVAESYPSRLVGIGRVRGSERVAAYRYSDHTPIIDDEQHPWRHLIDVVWEQKFEVRYPFPWSAQAAVLDLQAPELKRIRALLDGRQNPKESRDPSALDRPEEESRDDQIQQRQLEDWAYTRYTAAAIKTIQRRHVALCNRFTSWLTCTFAIPYEVERRNVDLSFRHKGATYLIEFKIAYSGDAKPAIREALGQILEYLKWLTLPLFFGWPSRYGFEFSDGCPLSR